MADGGGPVYCLGVGVGRPKQFDEREALQRAMELFWQRGFEAASLPALLGAMGISRQSLYDTYGNKRSLYVRALEHYRATQLSQALALLERPRSPLENVRSVMRFFQELAANPRLRGCFVANALMGPQDAEIAELLRSTVKVLREAMEAVLRDAQQRGELGPTQSPALLSRALANAIVGMSVSAKLGVGHDELEEICTGTLSMLD